MSDVYEFPCPNCGQVIKEKTLRAGSLKRCRACHQRIVIPTPPPPLTDSTPYGLPLTERVADYLQRGGEIAHRHPYFCGVGLAFRNGEFVYGYVEEGGTDAFLDSTSLLGRFPNREDFIAWLAVQSDTTLSGNEESDAFLRGNQRITRERLEAALHQSHTEAEKLPAGSSM